MSDLVQEARGPVEVLELEGLEARGLHGAEPGGSLQVRARRAQPLQGQGEAGALEVEAELPLSPQGLQELREPLELPEPSEDEGGTPGARLAGLESPGPHALDDAQLLAVAREASEQIVELAGGEQDVAAAERGEDLLPDTALLAVGADDLEVLVGPAVLDTTFRPDEHARIVGYATETSRIHRETLQILGTTFPPSGDPTPGSTRLPEQPPPWNCRR